MDSVLVQKKKTSQKAFPFQGEASYEVSVSDIRTFRGALAGYTA